MNANEIIKTATELGIRINKNGGYFFEFLFSDMTEESKEKLNKALMAGGNGHSVTRAKWHKTGKQSNQNYGPAVKLTVFAK